MAAELRPAVDQAAAAPEGRAASHVRSRQAPQEQAADRRVEEYLRAIGLNDAERLAELCQRFVDDGASEASESEVLVEPELETPSPEAAVERAQAAYEAWETDTFGPGIDPLWLRAFFAAHPEAVLASAEVATSAAAAFGDAERGSLPTAAKFVEQPFERARVPRWISGLALPLTLTLVACAALVHALAGHEFGIGEAIWCALFCVLFGCAATGFSTALLGAFGRRYPSAPRAGSSGAPLPRSVVVMPICHEDAEFVFASIAAMRESLAKTPGGEAFEIFVLSDSRDPRCAAEEERAFRRVAGASGPEVPVYYRRRIRHERQKAGNLAEFFERWGDRYTYAVVLDADSLMHGETLVEMVRRMEENPRLGLLQAPLALHQGRTLFARTQQFVSSVAGPLFIRGLGVWAGEHGNYYGHNAALRVRAFLDCCALPTLSGAPPFGGHVLSHDFVEAALLCRAGWQVRTADDLGGSYEQLPATLSEYVARDRRWCQGNLQHVRLIGTRGFKPMSRIHLLLGVLSYLVGPLWLAFVALGACLPSVRHTVHEQPWTGSFLFGAALFAVLSPRLFGAAILLCRSTARALHGGALRFCVSLAFEVVLSALLAPLFMIHHTRIVFSIVVGRTVGWKARPGGSSTPLGRAVSSEVPASVLGLATVLLLAAWAPELVWALAPVWLPLCLAIPLNGVVSSEAIGGWLRRVGLLLVPSETRPETLSLRAEQLQHLTHTDAATRFRDLVLDPLLVNAQSDLLARGAAPRDGASLRGLCERALRVGPGLLTAAEREALTNDADSLRWLHRHAWRHWPVESWQMGRRAPMLPPSDPLAA